MTSDEGRTEGWEAIDQALAKIYGNQEPFHYGTVLKGFLGGKDPLDGISVYRREDPVPHWHYITYGFTELYAKESDDPQANGFGFELTFRLLRGDENEPPAWPLSFLQNLARYVFGTGNVFAPGHHLNSNGPIALGVETDIRAALFVEDPELGPFRCAHGNARFLQVVGITTGEEEAIYRWNSTGVVSVLKARTPLLCTDLTRQSVLLDPQVAREVEEGARRDGSDTAAFYVTDLQWEATPAGSTGLALTFGANPVKSLMYLLPGRLLHGRDLFLQGSGRAMVLTPAETCGWREEENILRLSLDSAAVRELAQRLAPRRMTFQLDSYPALQMRVIPTQIKDQDGNVVEVIG